MDEYIAKQIDIDPNFQTPPDVCEYMVSLIPESCCSILEPTPGIGNLVEALKNKQKFNVTAANDFFLLNHDEQYDCIVMNPPFTDKSAYMYNAPKGPEMKGMKLGYYILRKCMEMSENIIALMPWFTISDSDVRMRCLVDYGIKSITPLPRKTFQYARIQTVVLQLNKGYSGAILFKTPFHSINY